MSKIAYSKKQKEQGIKGGYTVFPYSRSAKRRFNMYNVPFPISYKGYEDGDLIDEGYAYPEEEFDVRGDTVIETPMYQIGGRFDLYADEYDFESDYQPMLADNSSPLDRYAGTSNTYTPGAGLNLEAYDTSSILDSSTPSITGTNILGNKVGTTRVVSDSYENMTPADYPDPRTGNDFGNRLKWYDMPIASTAYNLYQGIFGRDRESHQFNRQAPTALEIMKNMQYRPDYSQIRLSNNRLEQQIRNSSSSPQQMLARMQNSQTRLNQGFAQMDRQAQHMNNQYQGQYAQALNREGMMRARERARVADANLQHQAGDDAHIAAAANAFDSTINQKRKLDQARMDNRMRIATLATKYPKMKSHIAKLFPEYELGE